MEELKLNFAVVNNVKTYKQFKSFVEYEHIFKKVQSPLNNTIMYSLKTFNEERAVPYFCCIWKLSKISCNYHRNKMEKD